MKPGLVNILSMQNMQNKQNMQNLQNTQNMQNIDMQESKISESESSINSRTFVGHLVLFLRETVCGFENYTNCLSILRPNVIIAPLYFPLRMNWSTVFARSHLPRVPSLLPPPGLSLWENRENWKINQAPEAAAAPRGELQKGAQVRCLSSVGAKYWLGCDWKYYLPAGVEEG